MSLNFSIDFIDHNSYPESIYSFYQIEIEKFKNCSELIRILTRWLMVWNFQSFNDILSRLLTSNSDSLHSICLFIQHDILSNQPVGLLIFLHNPPQKTMYTDRLILYWILDPNVLKKNMKDFIQFTNASQFWDIIFYTCQKLKIDFYHIAFLFFEWPTTVETHQFSNLIGISAKEYEQNPTIEAKWIFYQYNCDQKVESQHELLGYIHTYHFLNYNPYFDSKYIPEDLLFRMDRANMLYNCFLEYKIPVFLIEESKIWFNNLLLTKTKVEWYYSLLKERLDSFKSKLNLFRKKFLSNELRMYRKNYCLYIKNELQLMFQSGIRIRIFNSSSHQFRDLLEKYSDLFLLNIVQTIPTEGSMFEKIFDSHGNFNKELLDLNYLQFLFGSYIGVLEIELSDNMWLPVGLATGFYRKKSEINTLQMVCGLIFISNFRGYGFGEILALTGMIILELNNKIDIVYEDATIRNIITGKLIKKIGFESYGIISKQAYDITGKDLVGIYRTYRFSSKILQNLINLEKNDMIKKSLLTKIRINENIKRTLKNLIRKKQLYPLIE